MKVITIANQKGGTGKSTIAANLACVLANDKYKVLAVDSDIQSSLSDFHAIRTNKEITPIFSTIKIVTPVIHKEIPKFENAFNIVIIDTGGRASALFTSALSAADIVIIPITPSPYDIWASEETFKLCETVKTYKTNLEVYLLINMVIERTRVIKDLNSVLEEIVENYKFKIFNTQLHNLMIYKYAIDEGLSAYEKDKNNKAGNEFLQLYKEIKIIINK